MVQLDKIHKKLTLKVVVVGCALGGKTTSLAYLHQRVLRTQRSRLLSLSTASDRTLFFDLLPLDLGTVHGYSVKLQIYTVPGHVSYAAPRRSVLADTDAVLFVANSSTARAQANSEALRDLAEQLSFNGLDIHDIPLVLQYNKRDLPGVEPLPVLEAMLNPRASPSFESVANTGKGVVPPFLKLIELAGEEMVKRLRLPADFGSLTRAALQKLLLDPLDPAETDWPQTSEVSQLEPEPEPPAAVPVSTPGALQATARGLDVPELEEIPADDLDRFLSRSRFDAGSAIEPEEMLSGALGLQQAMVGLSSELDAACDQLRRRAAQMAELGWLMGLAISQQKMPQLLIDMLRSIARSMGDSTVTMLLPDLASGGLHDATLYGAGQDPLNHVPCLNAPSVAVALFRQRKSSIGPADGSQNNVDRYLTRRGISSHMLVPLDAQGLQLGMLGVYRRGSAPPFDSGDCAFFTAAAALVALTLETTRLRNLVQAQQVAQEPPALRLA